jgi:hypothetical protein
VKYLFLILAFIVVVIASAAITNHLTLRELRKSQAADEARAFRDARIRYFSPYREL